MQTNRDAQIVNWLGRVGAAGVQHVTDQFDMSDQMAYKRLALLAADGLVERRRPLYDRPSMYLATLPGLRWQGQSRFGVFHLSAGGCEHTWQVTTAMLALSRQLPSWRILTEREIRAQEIEEGRLFASADAGPIGHGTMRHRPDLAVVSPSDGVVSIEVELTIKDRRRLAKISRGWARARHVDHVYYLATPEAARAVGRALDRGKATDRVTVLDLEDVAGLAAHALAREAARVGLGAQGMGSTGEAPKVGLGARGMDSTGEAARVGLGVPGTSSTGEEATDVRAV
jgi:hypothetical protein